MSVAQHRQRPEAQRTSHGERRAGTPEEAGEEEEEGGSVTGKVQTEQLEGLRGEEPRASVSSWRVYYLRMLITGDRLQLENL